MAHMNRRSAPKVRDGRVQRKNRHAPTPSYWNTPQAELVIDRQRPGEGFRHVLRKEDVLDFVRLLPDWPTLSRGLDAVVLARKSRYVEGWHDNGVIGLCAWPREIVRLVDHEYAEEHEALFERLDVPAEPKQDGVLLQFTEDTARDYLLLHVFLHELGHLRDRMTNKSRRAARGEPYAEAAAYEFEEQVFHAYFARTPRRSRPLS